MLGMKLGRNVISLESDTIATSEWAVPPEAVTGWDIMHVHNHKMRPSRTTCKQVRDRVVDTGWRATGALFVKLDNMPKIVAALTHEAVRYPIDHWLTRQAAAYELSTKKKTFKQLSNDYARFTDLTTSRIPWVKYWATLSHHVRPETKFWEAPEPPIKDPQTTQKKM